MLLTCVLVQFSCSADKKSLSYLLFRRKNNFKCKRQESVQIILYNHVNSNANCKHLSSIILDYLKPNYNFNVMYKLHLRSGTSLFYR